MPGHYDGETIANWVSDFVQADALTLFPPAVQAIAEPVLATWLSAACRRAGVAPTELGADLRTGEGALRDALIQDVAAHAIPADARPFVPSLGRAFLGDLETRGRLGRGAELGRFAGALQEAWALAPGGSTPFVRPGPKVGRNAPCPCGSGKKFKHCCGS
jgi:hypothetical protein